MRVQLLDTIDSNIKLEVKEDTQYVLVPADNISVDLVMNKEGVSAEVFIPFSLKENDDVSFSTRVIHKVPNTSCLVNVKGVLFDKSRSNYLGKIVIEKGAQKTNTSLEDNILSIGEKTRNHAQPILEIKADDVKASHGATTGRIDEEQIYYLMTRGLSREEAQGVIIGGFLEALLVKIKDTKIRNKVREQLYV